MSVPLAHTYAISGELEPSTLIMPLKNERCVMTK